MDDRPRREPGPPLPEWVDQHDLDPALRTALRGLDPRNAVVVGQHLVAAGGLLDDDPETALAHARAARDRASRVAAVREAVGVTAYHAGDFAEAARELRAYRRMSGDESYRAVLADCERALGRPDVALKLVAEALETSPDRDEVIELRLVEAGVRRDLGELAAAVLVLESALGGRPRPSDVTRADLGRLRLATAYADALQERGDEELAMEWFAAIAASDPDDLTGVSDRFGTVIDSDDDDEDGDEDGDDEPEDDDEVELEAEVRQVGDDEPEDDADDDPDAPGYDPAEDDVEAEVAELLGELPPRAAVEHDHSRLFQSAPAVPSTPDADDTDDTEHEAPTN